RAVVALVGVGVNADVNTADLDAGVRHRATSIRELARTPLPPELAATAPELLSRKLQSAIEWPGAAVTTVPSVRERLWGVGRMVPITLPGGARVMGRIDGITDAGHLLATISGEQHTFRSVDHLG
ncbi:MAG TPA: hypothetical protein VFF65_08315, partial [Phycisphaerales bacterium]|nr:hypothetical protein [Phycisphaerales bacterium]